MSNVVITDSAKFENIINNFNKTISNIENVFEKENENFKKIDGTDIWNSDLQLSITKKYNELSNNYADICDSLKSLSGFMQKSLNDYENFENTYKNAIVSNDSQLDVNS